MNLMLASFFSGWQIILIVAVILVLFGAKKIPEFAKGLGQGIKEFKTESSDEEVARDKDAKIDAGTSATASTPR